jgi:uncharacterized protein (DUF305 family)
MKDKLFIGLSAAALGILIGLLLGLWWSANEVWEAKQAMNPAAAYRNIAEDHHADHDHTHDASMADMMHNMNAVLEGKSGAEFDAAFLAEMIVHHQGAVDMAALVLERSENAELRAFAQAIADAQVAEIEQMQAWQEAWFPLEAR